MTKFQILDETVSWDIKEAIIVYVQDWKNNFLVGDYKGCVVALIPYQSEDGRENALSIAKQIIAAKIDCTSPTREETE